ncbi:MAG: hypothetical protein BMS9Abin28_0876 [Anaerolineae bacterium]|nr:MAG: hypothetical protein BMS9Abin28_0876 [Anaerolineae bacterium]
MGWNAPSDDLCKLHPDTFNVGGDHVAVPMARMLIPTRKRQINP